MENRGARVHYRHRHGQLVLSIKFQSLVELVKRYPEPMAHDPEACEPSHPCGSC